MRAPTNGHGPDRRHRLSLAPALGPGLPAAAPSDDARCALRTRALRRGAARRRLAAVRRGPHGRRGRGRPCRTSAPGCSAEAAEAIVRGRSCNRRSTSAAWSDCRRLALHADGAAAAAGLRPAVAVYDCMDELSAFAQAPAGARRARASCCAARTSSSPAGAASTRRSAGAHEQRLPVPVERGRRALRAGARARRPSRTTRADLPRPRLGFSGVDRRAARHRAARRASPTRGRTGSSSCVGPVVEDRPERRLPQRAEHPLPRRASLRGAAAPTWPAGTSALMPFAQQRGDPVHQPDEDAGVPRGRPAGGLDADRATSSRPTATQGLVRDRRWRRRRSSRPARRLLGRADRRRGGARRTRASPEMSWDRTWSSACGSSSARRPRRREHAPHCGAAGAPSRRAASTTWSSAPASPAACWPSAWRARAGSAC